MVVTKGDGLGPAESAAIFSREVWSVLTLRAVRFELEMLRDALAPQAKPLPPDDVGEEEWEEIVTALLPLLGSTLSSGISAASRATSDRDRSAIAHRIGQALRAVAEAERTRDEAGSPSGALLPASFPRRVEYLLGFGELPLAWVRRMDVLMF